MRILGIDLGSTSIKAVEIESAFGRFEIHDYHEHKIEQNEEPALAINRLFQSLPRKPERIAVALPTRNLTFRNLRFPTRDRKEIQASVGFELEDELPFDLEKAVYDFSILAQNKQGTEIHVATTLRSYIENTIQLWNEAGIDPDIITTESWAYRTLLNRTLTPTEQSEPILLAQIGDQRTTLYVHWHGTPILARELPWGGRDLTTAIAEKYQLSLEQAEAAKLDHGFVVSAAQRAEVTHEQLEFSNTLMRPIREFISALRQTELTCKSMTHHCLSKIYLTGGTTLLPGLTKVIEETFSIPVRPLRSLSSLSSSGVTYSDHSDSSFTLAAAIGLCVIGSERASLIHFRKGEFSKKGESRELNLITLKKPLIATTVVLTTMILSIAFESMTYSSKLKDADTELGRAMKSFFGSISSSAVRTYMSNPVTLKSNINKELEKQRQIVKLSSPNPHSPVDLLKTISATIPKDVVVDLLQFQAGDSPTASYLSANDFTVNLTFKFSNAETADRILALLGNKITGLQKNKPEEVTDADGNRSWKVTFSGKPTEDAYAK